MSPPAGTKRSEPSSGKAALPVPKAPKAAAKVPGASLSSTHGGSVDSTPTGPPAPVVPIEMPSAPPVPGSAQPQAPTVPVLPTKDEAANYGEEKTVNLMRATVAYNKYHVQRVMKEDNRWFKGWDDKPVHEHQPLTIRKPDSKDDLLTYVSPWKRRTRPS